MIRPFAFTGTSLDCHLASPRSTNTAVPATYTPPGDRGAEGAKDFLLFNIYPAETGEESRASVGFAVEHLDEVHATLERAGVDVVHPPEVRAWGRTGVYRDPDGNTISVTEQPSERSEVSGTEPRA